MRGYRWHEQSSSHAVPFGSAPRESGNSADPSLWRSLALRPEAETGRSRLSPSIQRKATVSSPGDSLEREADIVADKVMRLAEPGDVGSAPVDIQRKCTACEDEEKIQTKPESATNSRTGLDTSAAVSATESGGAPLSSEARSFFEPRFGQDFGDVRIHADGEAAHAAHGVRAKAYTYGNDIVFGAGEFSPTTTQGRRLLAHELTHVVQQRGSESIQRDVEEGVDETAPMTGMDEDQDAETMDNNAGGCKAEVNRNFMLKNSVDTEFTVPKGCKAVITFTALWVPNGGQGVECCSGADTYTVTVNGGKAKSLPVGPNICGDDAQHKPRVGTVNTGSGRQQVHIKVNRDGCDGIAMELNVNIKIR